MDYLFPNHQLGCKATRIPIELNFGGCPKSLSILSSTLYLQNAATHWIHVVIPNSPVADQI